MSKIKPNPLKHQEHHFSVPFSFDTSQYQNNPLSQLALVDVLFAAIKELSAQVEYKSFKIGASWWEMTEGERDEAKKAVLQGSLIQEMDLLLGKTLNFTDFDAEFLVDFGKKVIFLHVTPVYVQGKYCKFSREIAQTEFFCNRCGGRGCWYCKNTGHFCDDSVEQMLGKVMNPHFKSSITIMHGAGREDMNVLMLGKGRPFIAELAGASKRTVDLAALEKEINETYKGKISVNSLRFVTLHDVSALKESPHDKIYLAVVSCDAVPDLSKLKLNEKISVSQFTPKRVMKRRGDVERKKEVVLLSAEKSPADPKEFTLEIRTSHGTYLKEFISSDDGRTTPSVGSLLGVSATCKQLDVIEICE